MLLFRRFDALRTALAALALAAAVLTCSVVNDASSRLLPTGVKGTAWPVVYVDGSHLGAMGNDPWGENGIGRLVQVLAHNNYLPLVAPDLGPQRLNRAAMLISIGPGKAFSGGEMAAVQEFVQQGGFFLSMVGSPDTEPSRPLLESFQLDIKPMPVPPWVGDRETTPHGPCWFPEDKPMAGFYAAWPVSGPAGGSTWPEGHPLGPVIAGNRAGAGQAFIIGDTAFALNKNFESSPRNADFWRIQLKSWLDQAAEKPQGAEPHQGGILGGRP